MATQALKQHSKSLPTPFQTTTKKSTAFEKLNPSFPMILKTLIPRDSRGFVLRYMYTMPNNNKKKTNKNTHQKTTTTTTKKPFLDTFR